MKFEANSRRRAFEYEKDLVEYWREHKTFEKSVENRPADNAYVFYDGPPFITGVPHHGTLLSSIVKDAVPRYWTMKGKRVERVWGWDCHGLPAENFTEKKLGITDRHDIGTKISLEDYIVAARDNMVSTGNLWEDTIARIGRWVDFKGAYKTMDRDFMESVWWAFKTLYEKGKIYEGEKVLMYDTKWATPLSKAEVTMDAGAYQDVTDPSVYVKFKMGNSTSDKRVQNFTIDDQHGYIMFDLTDQVSTVDFPGVVGGLDLKKDEFHVSLLKIADQGDLDDATKVKLEEVSKAAGQSLTAVPRFTGEFLQLVDDERGRESIIGLLEWEELATWQDRIRTIVPDAVFMVPHVTLYIGESGPIGYSEKTKHFAHDIDSATNEILTASLKNQKQSPYLLAWTTTPWTLPANTALAVNTDVTYAEVIVDETHFIVAKDLIEKVFTDEKHAVLPYEIVRELLGEELVGKRYEPLFENRGPQSHKIWAADYVTTDSGTGIVHLAPAYGEEDFELARREGIPVVHVLDDYGVYTEGDWQGQDVWESNKRIAKELLERRIVWKIDYYRHEYPHNPRTGNRLMYRAHPSWFFDVDGQRTEMLEKNTDNITWFPPHIKHGRFEKTVETAPDWNLSRDRFWATAMPVWKGDRGSVRVIGSYAELKELSGVELDDYHRPWVDDITFDIDGEHFTRIDKVLDGWFESGSMPFAQFHYPFENKAKFESSFPGDFIAEYVGQVRAWFYYLHAVNVGLFGTNAFKNVIVTGTVAGNDGRKMSKSYGNFTDPNELMDKYSADSLRFLLLQSPLLSGEDFALQDRDVADVARKLSMVWNMYDFFTTYASVDGWEFSGELADPLDELTNPLDIWVISRVHQLTADVAEKMDAYDIAGALKPVLPFIDDASNWYVRRSRRRFWKSEDDNDKNDAYRTLHYVLVRLSLVLAPFTPFLAEELYRKLTGGESVHLLDWPEAGKVNELVVADMERVREYVNAGLSLRAQGRLKVRQPLSSVTVPARGESIDFDDILKDELNVKDVLIGETVAIDTEITPELKREGQAREVIRFIQNARKDAGLNVDDRIVLSVSLDGDLQQAIDGFAETIKGETLAVSLVNGESYEYETTVKVDGEPVVISLKKA